MKKRFIYSYICFTILLNTPAWASESENKVILTEALSLVDAWLESVHIYKKIPALSAGIVIGDKLVWSKGYGTIDYQNKVPASSKTIYSICSISKLFTSVALMQQYEMGKVKLSDPITKYLPWAHLKGIDNEKENMTIQRVLTHSAGLPREADFPYWSAPDFNFPSQEQIKRNLPEQVAFSSPGQFYHYSNLGMMLIGVLIEKVSGESYGNYCKLHILTPLGLTDTRSSFPVALLGQQMAAGFGAISREGVRQQLKPFDVKGMTPAAGYTSTVADLARFIVWQFNLLRTNQTNLLHSSTLREMHRVQYLLPDWKNARGLGFYIKRLHNNTFVGHDGRCPGYSSEIRMRNRDETGVIILMNATENPDPVVQGIYAILDKRRHYAFKHKPFADKSDMESYSGQYTSQPWSSEEIIAPWAGGLVLLELPANNPVNSMTFLKSVGKDLFVRVRDDGTEAESFQFSRNSSGNVTGYYHYGNWSKRLATTSKQNKRLK